MLAREKTKPVSNFYNAALKSEKDKEITSEEVARYEYKIKTEKSYLSVLPKEIKIKELVIRDEVTVISSPEAESIAGAGCIEIDKKGKEVFKLPRNHFGVRAQIDMEVAMWQLAMSKSLGEVVKKSNEKNSGIIYFAREGGITQWQKAVFLANGKSLPTTLVCIHHKKAKNQFTRTAEVVNGVNLEGFPLDKLENLYLCDPVASGMQQICMIEKLVSMGVKAKRIIVIAPMGSKFGLKTISIYCKSLGIDFKAGVCASLLDNTLPLRYYSPYPASDNQVADLKIKREMEKVFGEKLNKFCIRCNWTGSFWASEELALNDSRKELADIKMKNSDISAMEKEFYKIVTKNKGLRDSLLPYSSNM